MIADGDGAIKIETLVIQKRERTCEGVTCERGKREVGPRAQAESRPSEQNGPVWKGGSQSAG